MPFWPELEEVDEIDEVEEVVLELDDEVREGVVLVKSVDEELTEALVLLRVWVGVELETDDDGATEDPEEEVGERDESVELRPDDVLETEDVELGACRLTAETSTKSVSTTATATIA